MNLSRQSESDQLLGVGRPNKLFGGMNDERAGQSRKPLSAYRVKARREGRFRGGWESVRSKLNMAINQGHLPNPHSPNLRNVAHF